MAKSVDKGTQRVEQVVPSAARTVESLRDIGYDLPRAVADLVDNSIAAEATEVDVTLHFAGDESWIRVADNGHGMDASTIREAMRYGSERDYSSSDLGKFGFGLKTASTSQCRRVTVATRQAEYQRRFEVRCLDLDHIEKSNRWEVLVLEDDERPEHVLEPIKEQRGTVVLWEDLDRVIEYNDPWGGWARRRMLGLAEEIDEHLAMVFHRFLSGEVRNQPLTITVNGSKVEPWDPFCRGEAGTEELPAKDLRVVAKDGFGIVRVRPYVLPPQAEFSDTAAWNRASGPAKWNRQQGFYIYRANRLIQSGGGWNRLRTTDEHTKLARVALDFYPNLDTAFGINIAKAYVRMPSELREDLKPLVDQVARRADQRYRAGERESRHAGHSGQSKSSGSGSVGGKASVRPRAAIENAAKLAGEREALERIIKELMREAPEVARALGW